MLNDKLLKEHIEKQKGNFKLVNKYANLLESHNIPLSLRPAMAMILENEKTQTQEAL